MTLDSRTPKALNALAAAAEHLLELDKTFCNRYLSEYHDCKGCPMHTDELSQHSCIMQATLGALPAVAEKIIQVELETLAEE